MIFKPIIHNLHSSQEGYKECQLYNNLIANKPTSGTTLTSKLSQLKAWERLCSQALQQARAKLNIAEEV
jgi:hypothetical protein